MADALLDHALQHELPAIDEQVYFNLFQTVDQRHAKKTKRRSNRPAS